MRDVYNFNQANDGNYSESWWVGDLDWGGSCKC